MESLQKFLDSTVIVPTILIAIVSLFIFLSKQNSRNKSPQLAPPEASGALSVIGHLHHLAGPQPAHKTLGRMADKHGPIFTIRIGVHQTLVVSNREVAKECFTTNDKIFADRPRFVASETLTYNFAFFGFSPYGPYWRQIRKIATLELLSNHRLENLRHVSESEVKAAFKEFYDSNKRETEMKKWFSDLTLNVVFKKVFGERYGDATASEDGGGEQYHKTLREFFEFMETFNLSDALPWLRWLDLGGHEKAMKATMKKFDGLAQRLLDKHKSKKKEVGPNSDFMDVLISILDGAEVGDSYDADTVIKATSMQLILAASDTTAITMTWAMALLLNNRQALMKVHQELDDQVGRERQVIYSDLKNLVYFQAILKETLRLYPAAPLSVPHESTEDCTIAGYHIPARTRLLVNLSRLQRDPSAWADPNKFRPERFLTEEGKSFDVRGQNYELIPFGSGRRMCPGISFALQVIQLSLASLLHGFDIATPGDQAVDMTESAGLTNIKASPLNVLLTPRLAEGAY